MSNKWEVWTTKRTEELGDLFGVFFEDINHAADGGLYGELVQNRSFEFSEVDNPNYHPLTAWEKSVGSGIITLNIEDEEPVNFSNPHYLAMEVKKPGKNLGVYNTGFGSGILKQVNTEGAEPSCSFPRCVRPVPALRLSPFPRLLRESDRE